jgi:hypothetical protein
MNTTTPTTKTLIVTETLRYEFALPPDHPEDTESLTELFCSKEDPWREAEFAAVTEREVMVQTLEPLPACLAQNPAP